ncbi:hypothetical protein HYX15_03955 [Candidatus Woesearchaeota archaeon]|nr:hypothetical protein [Candidatus Woesearchaeota archaeon]
MGRKSNKEKPEKREYYRIEGHYENSGKKLRLTGSLIIDNAGNVKGTVLDHGSEVKEQKLEGKVWVVSEETKLVFVKYYPENNLANSLYQLRKENNNVYSGLYKGKWNRLPRPIDLEAISSAQLMKIPEYNIGENIQLMIAKH